MRNTEWIAVGFRLLGSKLSVGNKWLVLLGSWQVYYGYSLLFCLWECVWWNARLLRRSEQSAVYRSFSLTYFSMSFMRLAERVSSSSFVSLLLLQQEVFLFLPFQHGLSSCTTRECPHGGIGKVLFGVTDGGRQIDKRQFNTRHDLLPHYHSFTSKAHLFIV